MYYDWRQWWEEGPPASVSPDSAGLTHCGSTPLFFYEKSKLHNRALVQIQLLKCPIHHSLP